MSILPMNIVLIGYRGTGKSTVGRQVAAQLAMEFVDADEELESRAGRSIREIFASGGEGAFRDLEAVVIGDLLQGDQRVTALGGGAVLRPDNREQIRRANNRVVWLQADAATLHERIDADAATSQRRPNLTATGGLPEIERLLAIREPLYRECAEFVVNTEGKTPEQVAAEVVSLLVA
jgi:shikimate kinase